MRKHFDIDWESLDEVTRLMNQSKSRYFELKRASTGTPTRKERHREILSAALTIFFSDISHVYANVPLDEERKFYVYAHLDVSRRVAVGASPLTTFAATIGMTHFPFYVGKGTGDRCFDLNRSETHRKIRQKLSGLGMEVKVHRIQNGLTETEALQLESKLIDIFGLITHSGYLTNLDEGLAPAERRACYRQEYETLRKLNGAIG